MKMNTCHKPKSTIDPQKEATTSNIKSQLREKEEKKIAHHQHQS